MSKNYDWNKGAIKRYRNTLARTQLCFPLELKDKVADYCKKNGLTFNQLITNLLNRELEKEGFNGKL